MKKKISFLIDNIEQSELLYDISQFVNKSNNEHDIIIFFKNHGVPYRTPSCPQMNICDLYGYGGSAIATSIDTARILINAVGPQEKIFYPYDVEWLSFPTFSYGQLNSIFNSKDLLKFCRSESHKKAIENSFDAEYNIAENIECLLPYIMDGKDYLTNVLEIDQFYERQEILPA